VRQGSRKLGEAERTAVTPNAEDAGRLSRRMKIETHGRADDRPSRHDRREALRSPNGKSNIHERIAMSQQPPDGNSRKNERLTINKEFDSFDQFIQEYVTNISRSGAFIKTSTPLPIGSEVTLRFTVVMDDVEVIEGLGEVVRIETDPPGMGVVFKKLSKYSEKLIQKLLSKG
jgi:hypothetical protein